LSISDRRRFFTFLEMGASVAEIAKKLFKHRSTLYRELKRNSEDEIYSPHQAQLKTAKRALMKRPGKLQTNNVLRDHVIKSLQKNWSPEQISGHMKYQKLPFYVCHETIYQFVYRSKNKELYYCLAYKKPKRQARFARQKSLCRFGNMRLITQRPQSIATRKRVGHWEGDTVEFVGNRKKVITTLVERKSRKVCLIKNDSKYSQGVMDKIKEKFKGIPSYMRKTITFDQGTEFADYKHLELNLKCKVYYCEAHSPWQKGSNENMNGRIRWTLPKKTDVETITQEQLDHLAERMNQCPRKCLGYKTPNEVFNNSLKRNCRTRH